MSDEVMLTGQSRIFLIEDRAGPSHAPAYQSLGRATTPAWQQGSITPIRKPSDEAYDQFEIIGEVIGQKGLPELTTEFRKQRVISDVLALIRKGCPIDIQVHVGSCQNPSDFHSYDMVIVLEGARPTNYTVSDFGAFDADQQAQVTETVPWSGRDYYEIKQLAASELGAAEIVQEVVAVAICDSRSCGSCGTASDGCQKVFAIQKSHGGSPGLPAELIYSSDAGTTLGQTNVTTLAANEDPTDIVCVGTNLVVTSKESLSLHYAATADVLEGTETLAEMGTGFVSSHGPNAAFSLGTAFTWFVGAGGYVYFSSDVTSAVTVQNAGIATASDLNDIHGADKLNLVAVGASNAVIVTTDGGTNWTSVTGPDVGVDLNTVWMKDKLTWFIGTAGGKLWYTTDGGVTWTEKAFTNSGSGAVRKVMFSTPTVGYMAHDYTPGGGSQTGRIFRTIDGGYSWSVVPENRALTFPTNTQINDLAGCGGDVNLVFGGGLNGTDGIFVKAA